MLTNTGILPETVGVAGTSSAACHLVNRLKSGWLQFRSVRFQQYWGGGEREGKTEINREHINFNHLTITIACKNTTQ